MLQGEMLIASWGYFIWIEGRCGNSIEEGWYDSRVGGMGSKSNREARGNRWGRRIMSTESLLMSTLLGIDVNEKRTTEIHESMDSGFIAGSFRQLGEGYWMLSLVESPKVFVVS
jgi:hypothetical protein